MLPRRGKKRERLFLPIQTQIELGAPNKDEIKTKIEIDIN